MENGVSPVYLAAQAIDVSPSEFVLSTEKTVFFSQIKQFLNVLICLQLRTIHFLVFTLQQ